MAYLADSHFVVKFVPYGAVVKLLKFPTAFRAHGFRMNFMLGDFLVLERLQFTWRMSWLPTDMLVCFRAGIRDTLFLVDRSLGRWQTAVVAVGLH